MRRDETGMVKQFKARFIVDAKESKHNEINKWSTTSSLAMQETVLCLNKQPILNSWQIDFHTAF